jgi:hypothetical protein
MPSQAHDRIPGLADRHKTFYASLRGEDDLGVVVRAHIHIEHELRQFVLIAAPAPTEVNFDRMTFEATVRLALVVGLPSHFRTALAAFGSLRNKFAHKLDMVLGKKEVADIYAALSPTMKRIHRSTYEKMRVGERMDSLPADPLQLSPRDQFTLMAVSTRTGLIAMNLAKRTAGVS